MTDKPPWPGRSGWPHKPDMAWLEAEYPEDATTWEELLTEWTEAREALLSASFFEDAQDRAYRLGGYAWGLDADVAEARVWLETAATCVRMWLDYPDDGEPPAPGLYRFDLSLCMIAGRRDILEQAAHGDFPSLSPDIESSSPHAIFGALLVRTCQADRPGMIAAADVLDTVLQSPTCEPSLTRMYAGIPDLAYAAAGTTDPGPAMTARQEAWIALLRRSRSDSAREPGAFIDILGLALPAIGVRDGINFPDTNPYMPLGLINPTLENRDVIHS